MKDLDEISEEYLFSVLTGGVPADGDMFVKFARIISEVKLSKPDYYLIGGAGQNSRIFADKESADAYCEKHQNAHVTEMYAGPRVIKKSTGPIVNCPKCGFANGINRKSVVTMCYGCGKSFERTKGKNSVAVCSN